MLKAQSMSELFNNTPYIEGKKAKEKGLSYEDNPYDYPSTEYHHWSSGWKTGKEYDPERLRHQR